MTFAARPSRRRRVLSLASGLAVASLLILAPLAHASTARVVDGKPDATLAGATEIDWIGNKGVLLNVPKPGVAAPQTAFRLYVTGGTYAFVRFMSASSCAGYTRCDWNGITHEPTISDALRSAGASAGEDFVYLPTTPAEFLPGLNEFYLFSNGHARLVFGTSHLAGKLKLTARHTIQGEVKSLSQSCTTSRWCTAETPVGELKSGGATHNFGRNLGTVEYVAASGTTRNGNPVSQAVGYQEGQNDPVGCMYPSKADPLASPEPSRHPDGCDVTPVSADSANPVATSPDGPFAWVDENQSYTQCLGNYECWVMGFDLDHKGSSYVGFRADRLSPDSGTNTAWAIWYSYGIH